MFCIWSCNSSSTSHNASLQAIMLLWLYVRSCNQSNWCNNWSSAYDVFNSSSANKSCNSANKSCILQVVHTKAIAASTQFCDFWYVITKLKLLRIEFYIRIHISKMKKTKFRFLKLYDPLYCFANSKFQETEAEIKSKSKDINTFDFRVIYAVSV